MSKNSLKLGQKAEQLAADYYLKLGHNILFRNFKTRYGEIDLITIYKDVIYLIEVKSTSHQNLTLNPYHKWNLIQKQRMIKVFKYYLADQLAGFDKQVAIHFIWFALNQENRLKLVCFNKYIELDYG